MSLSRVHRRCTTWLALLALVWSALVPTLVQAAVSGSGSGHWVQVCSSSGMFWVRADSEGAQDAAGPNSEPSMLSAMGSCTWCGHHGSAAVPPSDVFTPAVLRLPQARQAMEARFALAVPHRAALARGPPPLG